MSYYNHIPYAQINEAEYTVVYPSFLSQKAVKAIQDNITYRNTNNPNKSFEHLNEEEKKQVNSYFIGQLKGTWK